MVNWSTNKREREREREREKERERENERERERERENKVCTMSIEAFDILLTPDQGGAGVGGGRFGGNHAKWPC